LIPLRGGNGNYGYLAGFGSRTGGGETTEIYDSDKPAAFGRLLAKLTGGCRVDIDADGTVDVFDVIAFLRLYDDGDLAADFDADGVLTQADVMFFTTEADAGCQ
jgi:hypothetical protein